MSQAHFSEHPLYQDEAVLGQAMDVMLDAGQTIFQIYQMPFTEADHANWLLRITDPDGKAERVLSLGCGVGGMETYWKLFRPSLQFELVNLSPEQLKRCLCVGHKVCMDAETYHSKEGPFDLVVLCYLLGHVNVDMTLLSALGNLAPRGRMLVYDVFEGTKNFKETLFYETPSFKQLEIFGTANGLRFRAVIQDNAQIPMSKFAATNCPWVALESRPGLFVFQRDT